MELKQPFLKLPLTFCADTLAAEVRALPPSAWQPHPQRFVGNEAVPLITPGGEISNALSGPMAATDFLESCPYVKQVMAEIGAVWGRSRLMGLGPGADVPMHVDIDYYWRTHVRIHIPVVTNPKVSFTCDEQTIHMAPGECWVFDTFRRHAVHNGGTEQRIHLVLDTVGGERLWELMEEAQGGAQPRHVPPGEADPAQLQFERVNAPKVMSAWELRCHLAFLAGEVMPAPELDAVMARLDKFAASWTAAWTRFGEGDDGLPTYRELIARASEDLERLGAGQVTLRNGRKLDLVLQRLVFAPAVPAPTASTASGEPLSLRFDRPIFIVSTPRSGSTLLFETLAQAPGLYSTGEESHAAIESIPQLSPASRGWESNRLATEDSTAPVVEQLAQSFFQGLRDRDGRPAEGPARMLEKTPKNALRVPFFEAAFEDSHFVYLYRDPHQTLSSMMEAWQSGRFRTYPRLPGWQGYPWSLLLVPGWERLKGLPLAQIVAHQWSITTNCLIDDLERVPRERVVGVGYDAFLAEPQATVEKLAAALGLGWDRDLGTRLPYSRFTVSKPRPDKWLRNEAAIEEVWPIVEDADRRAREFLDSLER